MKLVENWQRKIWHWHSTRVAIGSAALWSAVGGAIMIWPALDGTIPLWAYVVGGILLSLVFGLARVLKQPGTE